MFIPILISVLFGAAGLSERHRPWFFAIGVLMAFVWFIALSHRYRLESTMAEIDRMTGIEFERFLAKLFRRQGYRTTHVGSRGGDFGADLIVQKNKLKIAVQAKNYDTSRVGNDAVQQAVAGASFYNCKAAIVVTNSTFTKAARQQAAGSNLPVSLWDRTVLHRAIRK